MSKHSSTSQKNSQVQFVAPGADRESSLGSLSKSKVKSHVASTGSAGGSGKAGMADAGANYAAKKAPKKHGLRACLCRLVKITAVTTILFLGILGGTLYYFLGTLSGAQKALEIAQRFIPSFVMVDTTIESGTIFEGLRLGKTYVEVKDLVTITADDLTLKYDLWQLKDLLFKVQTLESTNLHVALNDKLFEPSNKPQEPESEPFRLIFPLNIDLDNFAVQKFSLNSQIVDVGLDSIALVAKARADNLTIESLDTNDLTVHLKNEASIAQENAEIQAADAVDSQLAISVGGQVKQVEDLASAVNEVVTAAQQGKSVEFILANAQEEAGKYKAANAAASDSSSSSGSGSASSLASDSAVTAANSEHVANASDKGPHEANVVGASGALSQWGQVDKQSQSQSKAHAQAQGQGRAKNQTTAVSNVELTAADTVPVLLPQYSDPEVFAEAIEHALLNEQEVPAFSNDGVVITDPKRIKLPTNATLQTSIESASPTQNPLAAPYVKAAQAASAGHGDAGAVAGAGDAQAGSVGAGAEGMDENAVQMAERGRQAQGIAPVVSQSSSPVVKDFSDGQGAIAPLATVALPFNLEIKRFTGRKLRYVMDGFDTQDLDLDLAVSWKGTLLNVSQLDVHHAMGEASLLGSLNLDRFFDFDVKLQAQGYETEDNKALFEGALYGLHGDVTVQGSLTNLKVAANLNLGGSSKLDVQLNALSAALPMEVSLKVDHFAYPIFAEPIVDLKSIDFYSMGNLVDGIAVTLQSNVSGFDFKDVVTDFKGQFSFEKSHIDYLNVQGQYLGEPLEAKASGDLFYGSVLGADMKVYAKVKDAGFVHEMLSGPFMVDADLIAIMNNKELGKSAVSVASQPAYLEERIPVIQVSSEDFDPEALEAKLLAGASAEKAQKALSRVRPLTKPKMLAGGVADEDELLTTKASAQLAATSATKSGSGAGAKSSSGSGAKAVNVVAANGAGGLKDANGDGIADIVSVEDVAQAVDQNKLDGKLPASSIMAMASSNAASQQYTKTMGQEQIITQDQYIDALEQSNAKLVEDDKVMSTLFNQDLPEIKADIRYVKAQLYVNHQKTTVDIKNVVGDLQKGFRVQLLKILQGTNTLQAQGQLMERKADFQAIMNFNDFSAFVPGLEGEFKGQLTATGSMRDLNFALSGHVPKLSYNDIRVRKLVFDAAFNLQTQAFNFTALADRIRLSKSMKANRQLFLDFSGTPLRHNVTLTCDGSTALYLSVDGSLDTFANSYNANLLELYVSTEEAGTLSLMNPVFMDVDLNTTSGEIAPVELKGEIGLIKLTATKFAPGYVATDLSVRDFNLRSLKDLYPKGIFMYAPMDLDAKILVKNSQPNISAHISSEKGLFASSDVSAGLAYDKFDLTATFTQHLMHSEMVMSLRQGTGQITSVVDVRDPVGKGQLSGNFKINNFDLRTISNIGQSFNELNGMAQMDMTLGGTLYSPMIFGDFTVKGDAVPRYDVGQINNFDLKLTAMGQKGVLNGIITLNESDLRLNGELDWSQGANGSLVAQAVNMPVFLVGYGVARTNLDAQVTLGEILDIKAKVNIPSGRISVNDVASSGVVVSSDEILVSPQGTSSLIKESNAAPPMKSKMDVSVRFGDDVQVSALGMVKGRLIGGLDITQTLEDQTIKGNGEIQMVEGTAEVFSRKFSIDEARINFRNNITNPSLYVSVIADKDYVEDDVEVGVRVTGQANNPDIKLFSKPSMSENEILSYILYGHGLDKSSITQDSNNSNMLLGLGVSSMSGLVNSLAGAFGVQGLQVGSQGSGDETQVQVQGYISRRLRVSYGYGVFNAVGEFKIRYELVHQLYVEYISSIEQAVDLIYSFSFD